MMVLYFLLFAFFAQVGCQRAVLSIWYPVLLHSLLLAYSSANIAKLFSYSLNLVFPELLLPFNITSLFIWVGFFVMLFLFGFFTKSQVDINFLPHSGFVCTICGAWFCMASVLSLWHKAAIPLGLTWEPHWTFWLALLSEICINQRFGTFFCSSASDSKNDKGMFGAHTYRILSLHLGGRNLVLVDQLWRFMAIAALLFHLSFAAFPLRLA